MILLTLLLLLCACPAWAVPTYDATSSVKDFNTNVTSHNHTVGGACTNTIIVVAVASYVTGGGTVSALTIGGVGATQIAAEASSDRRVELWYRKGVSTGVNAIAVTMSATMDGINTDARSYCGVDQTTPLGTPTTVFDVGNGPPNISVASTVNDIVLDALNGRPDVAVSLAVVAPQTQRYNSLDSNGNLYIAAGSDKTGAASSTTMSWTQSGGDDSWASIGVALKPAAAAATGVLRRQPVNQ